MKNVIQGEIKRNGRKQPVVNGKTYSRTTTVVGRAEDKSGLLNYYLGLGAAGMHDAPDLQVAWANLGPEDRQEKRRILDALQERAGGNAKAEIGTAIHSVTESVDYGHDLSTLPPSFVADALAYRGVIDRLNLTPVAGEIFVVNEELGCAGTLDRILLGSKGPIVGDIKTSSRADSVKFSLANWSAQIAAYANGKPVLHDQIVEWEEVGLEQPSLEHGVVIHVQQGKAIGNAYRVDLVAGYERAKAAAWLRKSDSEFRKADKTPV